MTFCTDIDLLHWEPNIFRDAPFASQTLMTGTGDLAGTAFTIASGSFADNHTAADQVIVLSGAIAGSYPIVSVDSATQLTLSVMYDGLFPDDGAGQSSPAGSANGLSFVIRTFFPQRKAVSDLLRQLAGIGPGTAAPNGQVLNHQVLRRCCVLGTLHMIYSALAAAAEDPKNLSIRADLYERLYRRSLAQARVEIDLNGAGSMNVVRRLNVLQLIRA